MSESNARDELIEYIASGQTQKARDLLSDIPDGGVDDEGNTLYHETVTQQDAKLLKWLLANYQDRVPVTRTNKEGSTCFHLACAGGKTQTFLVLWENDSVSQKTLCQIADQEGRTPLHIACLNACSDVVRDIVYKFKEEVVNEITANGQTALHISAARGDSSSVRYLSPYKKLIDLTDSYGATPLHYAANGGHMVTAQCLIERSKADRTKVTQNEMNVVHAAVASGDARTIRYILTKTKYHQHLAKTSTGATVLHIATGMGYDGILSLLLQLKHIYPLIDHQEEKGWTASHLAALRNRAGCLAVLIGRAADVYNITDKNGMSAYQIMCNNESKEMRQTFPYLYEQINSLRSRSKAERRSDRRSHTTYSGTTQSGSESYEELYPPAGGPAYVALNGYAQPHYRSYPLPDEYLTRTQGLRYYDFGFPPRQAGFPPRNSSFQARPVSYPPRHDGFQNGYEEFRQQGSRERSRLRRDDFQHEGEITSSPSSQERHGSSQGNGREKVKLTESYIMKNKMDFTKTNPIADDDVLETPPQVKQRKFKRNTMALPQNNANQMPVMSFQTGKDNDSDGEFNIDDIEQIPETPLRKIQEFNNFRHSTYTPTQSTEDLTKVADDIQTSSSNSPPSKTARLEETRQLTVEINYEENKNTDVTVKTENQTVTYSPMDVSVSPQTLMAQEGRVSYHFSDSEDITSSDDSSPGEPLPIILDYQSRLVNEDDAVTIFFHNGELNTVKVKTVTERKIKKQKRKIVRKATGIPHQNTITRSVGLDQGLLITAEPIQVSQATPSARDATPILVTKVRESNSMTMRKSSVETMSLSSVESGLDAVEVNVISQYRSDTIMKGPVRSYIGPGPDDLPPPPPPPPQLSNSIQVHEINNSDSLEIVRHYRGADSVDEISRGQETVSHYQGADLVDDNLGGQESSSKLEIVHHYQGADSMEDTPNGQEFNSNLEIVHLYQGADLVDDNHGGQESINKLEIVHHYQGADLVGDTPNSQEFNSNLEIVHHYKGADLVGDNLGGQETINKLEIVRHYQGADLVGDIPNGQEFNSNLEIVHHYQGADLMEDVHNGTNLETVRSYRGAELEESFPPPPPPPVVSEFTVATSSVLVHTAYTHSQLEMMDVEQRSASPSPIISSCMSESPHSGHYHRPSPPPSPFRGRSRSPSEERYQIKLTDVRASTAGMESDGGRNNIRFSEIVDSETGELQKLQNPAREVTIIENIPPAPRLLPRLDFPANTDSERVTTFTPSPPPPMSPDYPTISSPSELSKGQFAFQVITTDDSSQVTAEAQTSRKVEFGSTELIPTSPDTVEKEYLSFAQNELRQSRELGQSAESEGNKRQEVTPEPQGRRPSILNIVQRFNSQDSTEAGEERTARPGSILERVRQYEQEAKQVRAAGENQEPVYAVINKSRQDVRQPLRRVPSNVSDASESSELKSSTAYKFNYRAYRKKISTKHDTVTDLFEYDPVS